jgi:hypothetical protein
MSGPSVSPRSRLAEAYALAFFPPRVHAVRRKLAEGGASNREEARASVALALRLHGRLPENGFSSLRALERLARRQARARAFGLPASLRRLYADLGGSAEASAGDVDGWMVRDIALPRFRRETKRTDRRETKQIPSRSIGGKDAG